MSLVPSLCLRFYARLLLRNLFVVRRLHSNGWRRREYAIYEGFIGTLSDSTNTYLGVSSAGEWIGRTRGHDSIVNSLAKYSKEPGDWVKFLPLALWADRISVRRSTGCSAFELVHGRECLLRVELSVASWSLIDWDDIKEREDLILARMLQLDERTLELSQAIENLRNSRKSNKIYFDQSKSLRPDGDQQLHVGDLVLHNSQKFKTGKPPRAVKLDDRWLGEFGKSLKILRFIIWRNLTARPWPLQSLAIVSKSSFRVVNCWKTAPTNKNSYAPDKRLLRGGRPKQLIPLDFRNF